ncbi:MAG: nucleoside triphosphate pyrophosphohydrolase [Cyanobacteria bacterium J06641_5]
MEKLVRDRVPEIMRQAGKPGKFEILTGKRYLNALRAKLCEEAAEVATAETSEELIAELADLLEVMETLVAAADLDWRAIRTQQSRKRRDRGGFAGGILLARMPAITEGSPARTP